MILDLFLCVPKEEPLKHSMLNICLLAVYIYELIIYLKAFHLFAVDQLFAPFRHASDVVILCSLWASPS